MRLIEGNSAINFEVKDYLGNEVRLSNYSNKKLLLSFFRGASCPFCSMRVRELIVNYPEFEKNGIQIITFFNATKEEIAEYAGRQNAPFPVIPDPESKLYQAYGVESSMSGMIKAMIKPLSMMKVMTSGFFNMKSLKDAPIIPADFLINENQVIEKAYYGKDFSDHLNIDEILKWASNN